MDEQRPPVTITNPAEPAGDVLSLGDERLPWRPTPRQVRGALGALVAVAVLGSVGWYVRDFLLDRQARHDVALESASGGDDYDQLLLTSTGSRPVEVLTVQPGSPGYPVASVGSRLEPGGALLITLPDRSTCPADPFAPGPRQVIVTARTERGDVLRRSVTLSPLFAKTFEHQQHAQCGALPAAESWSFQVVSRRTTATGAAITYAFRNTSVAPVTIAGWRGASGLALVRTPPPIELPAARAVGEPGVARLVTLTVRITDCRAWAAATIPDGEDNTGDAVFGIGQAASATVTRGTDSADIVLVDAPLTDDGVPADDPVRASFDRRCA